MNYKCLWQQITSSQSFDSDTRTTSDILKRIRRVRIQYRFRAIVCVGATRQTFHTQPIHNDAPAHDDLVRISLRKNPNAGATGWCESLTTCSLFRHNSRKSSLTHGLANTKNVRQAPQFLTLDFDDGDRAISIVFCCLCIGYKWRAGFRPKQK